MAALYLHHAVFASEATTTPASPRSSKLAPLNRHSASLSSVTLRTSNSDHSQPTEPLLNAPDSATSTVYQELLARQPKHPQAGVLSPPLSLHGDPVSYNEQKSAWERMVRRRLQRLRWTRRVMLLLIVTWAVYNTVRYFVAFTIYRFQDRQILTLVQGACTAVAVAFVLASILLSLFAPHLGWRRTPTALHVRAEKTLCSLASLLVVTPAIVNLVFTVLWRNSDPYTTLHGRCSWDLDVCWVGVGDQCPDSTSPSWRYWLVGAILRLLLTLAVVSIYHWAAYQYDVTRRPRGKHWLFHPRIAPPPRSSVPPAPPSPSPRPRQMASTTSWPASVTRVSSISTTIDDRHSIITHESTQGLLAQEPRGLRKAGSRIVAPVVPIPPPPSTPAPSTFIGRTLAWQAARPAARELERDDSSTSSSESEDALESEYERYGRAVHRQQGAYTPVGAPLPSPHPHRHIEPEREETPRPRTSTSGHYDTHQLVDFYHQFRTLVDQVRRESSGSLRDSPEPLPESPSSYDEGDVEHVPMVGRTVHRMPTIESLGSREVMSLASSGGGGGGSAGRGWVGSRPSTRAGRSDGERTPSMRSRSNSLDAALALNAADVSEMGEIPSEVGSRSVAGTTTTTTTTATTTNTNTTGVSSGTRSTQSWYTAKTHPDETRPTSEAR